MGLSWLGIYRSNRRLAVSTPLSPIVSEFETEEQAASYDRWFRAKVLDCSGQLIPDTTLSFFSA